MNPVITLAVQAVEAILPYAENLASGGVKAVIVMLEKIIPDVVSYGPDVVTSVENIIVALRGNGVVTAEQVAQLEAQATAMEAALDAAAAADGLTG